MTHRDVRFDDPDFLADPYPAYARLRRESPVSWSDHHAAWIIATYAEVRQVLGDSHAFSSAPSQAGYAAPYDDPAMIIVTDPPRHLAARRTITASGAFAHRGAVTWRSTIRSICLDEIDQCGTPMIEVVGQYALPAYLRFARAFFALEEELGDLTALASGFLDFYNPGPGALVGEMIAYMERAVAHRRRAPGSDPISRALEANASSGMFDDRQIALNFYDALFAGGASVIAVTAESLHVLASRPELQAAVYWEHECARDRAAEELLRWVNHIHSVPRTAVRDVEIGGVVIRAGERVRPSVSSANRDETVWANGETLDLERVHPVRHLAFGHGPHTATGASIARVFIAEAVSAFLECYRPFALAEPPQHARSYVSTPRRIVIVPDATAPISPGASARALPTGREKLLGCG